MMTRPFQGRVGNWTAPFVSACLLCGCSHESREQTVPCAESEEAEDGTLLACPEPQLESIDAEGGAARTTLPVAYPASELDRPLRLARPFPLVDRPLSSMSLSSPTSANGAKRGTGILPVNPEAHQGQDGPATSPEGAPLNGPDLGTPGKAPIELPSEPAEEEAPLAMPTLAPPEHLPAVEATAEPPIGDGSQAPGESPTSISIRGPITPEPRQANPTPRVRPRDPAPRLGPPAAHPSQAMRAVTQRAEQTIRHGYHLAERGALYSARAEFIEALRGIAQALDVQSGTREHIEALSAGLTALEEAEDFVPDGSQLESDLKVGALISAHQTPVCKKLDPGALLPVIVLQHYYTYAQERLTAAAGGSEAASMALFGLGKTYATMSTDKSLPSAIAEPKAMVFHWAALSAHRGNFMAANELAVLEARWGQNATARALLQYSVTILPHAAVWRNLAVVHQRLGEAKLAELAMREAQFAVQREAAAKPGNPQGIVPTADVQWLDSKEFAATSRTELDVQKPAAPEATKNGVIATPVVTPAPPRNRSAAGWWFPWLR